MTREEVEIDLEYAREVLALRERRHEHLTRNLPVLTWEAEDLALSVKEARRDVRKLELRLKELT